MWRHLITSRHQQRHSPCNKSSISPVHNKLKSNVFHCSVHTMHQTRVSNIEPSSRHIPDRDLCSVHMESQCNKFYSGQFLFLFISTYCKKNQKKKIKTRTELVSEKFPNAEKSCCVQYTECIMVRTDCCTMSAGRRRRRRRRRGGAIYTSPILQLITIRKYERKRVKYPRCTMSCNDLCPVRRCYNVPVICTGVLYPGLHDVYTESE